jgi:hypothetical protein
VPPPPQKTNAPPEQHVIASPNPTIDDSKTPATTAGPMKVEASRIQPVVIEQPTPMKTTSKSKSKSKHKHTKPRT